MKTRLAIPTALMLCCSLFPAWGANPPVPESFDKLVLAARGASKANQDDRASWQRAVAEAEKPTGNSAELAFALVHLGDAYCGKDNGKAIATYKRAIEVRETAGAGETLGMVRNLERYAMIKQAIEHSDAEAPLAQALALANRVSAPEAITFSIMLCLKDEYYNAKKFDQSTQLCLKMLEMAKQPNNPNAREERLAGYSTLLLIYSDSKKPREASDVRDRISEITALQPSADQVKAVQEYYRTAEKVIDDSEEQAFKLSRQ